MTSSQRSQLTQDLILALAYLTSFKEQNKHIPMEEMLPKAWKSYDWNALDQLVEKDFIYHKPRNKSLEILPEGEEKAKELVEKLAALLGASTD